MAETAQPAPVFIRPSKIQDRYGISASTVYRWKRAGKLTIHKKGAASFVRTADLEALITGQEADAK